MKKTIALVTDFGACSSYSGIMKGVIWSVNPHANIADLSHSIDPGDMKEAFYVLKESFDFFPPDTVFTVVVDPGVGSGRQIVAVKFKSKTIVAPDNGLALALGTKLNETAGAFYSITKKDFFLKNVSTTFHGRDIFAPVSAWLSIGLDPSMMGEKVEPEFLKEMKLEEAIKNEDGSILGKVIRIDRFGNLITNIRGSQVREIMTSSIIKIAFNGNVIKGVSAYYAQAEPSELLAIIGSSGYLELSINMANAAEVLSISKGADVIAFFEQ